MTSANQTPPIGTVRGIGLAGWVSRWRDAAAGTRWRTLPRRFDQRAGRARLLMIGAALAAGLAGAHEGHADYLVALARRASASLWITGFAVSEDGTAIELEGRMTDATVLTDYLRSLNAEPRFKGRPFAQLSLKAVDGAGGVYTEFALRSVASSAQATPPPGAGLTR